MKKTIITILAVTGIAGIGYAIWTYVQSQLSLLSQIKYTPQGITLTNLTATNVTLVANLLINNPSNITVNIKASGTFVNIYVNGAIVGKAILMADTLIPANGTNILPLTVSINPDSVASFSNLISVITGGGLNINGIGQITGSASGISHVIPINYNDTIKI